MSETTCPRCGLSQIAHIMAAITCPPVAPAIDAELAAERERIAQALADEIAQRARWDDGTEFIAVADAQRIARGD